MANIVTDTYTVNVKGANKSLDSLIDKNAQVATSSKKTGKSLLETASQISSVYRGVSQAFSSVMAMADKYLEASKKQQLADARLESIAKKVTKATDEQIESLKKLADQMQLVTTFGDEVVQAGQSQLLSYGLQADQAETLTMSLLDLLAATKGIDASQEDAINSANMLGKAISGQVGALSRAGILMTDYQKNIVKTGTQTEKVAILTEILADNYGGLAKSLTETDVGKLKQLKNISGDLDEAIGKKLIPIVIKIQEKLNDFTTELLNDEETIDSVADAVLTLTEGLGDLFVMTAKLAKIPKGLGEGLARLLNPEFAKQLKAERQKISDIENQFLLDYGITLNSYQKMTKKFNSLADDFKSIDLADPKQVPKLKGIQEQIDRMFLSFMENGKFLKVFSDEQIEYFKSVVNSINDAEIKTRSLVEGLNEELEKPVEKQITITELRKVVYEKEEDEPERSKNTPDEVDLTEIKAEIEAREALKEAVKTIGEDENTIFQQQQNAKKDILQEALNAGILSQEAYSLKLQAINEETNQAITENTLSSITESLEIISTLQSGISDIFSQISTNRMIEIDNEYKKKKDNIEKNVKDEDAKAKALEKLDKDYENKKREQQKKTAEMNKLTALFNIAIDTASAIVKVFPNPYLMTAAGILGATQAGVVASQPIPAFATGVVNMGGDGTATSDSNMAMLSKGESVVTAAGTNTGDNSLLLRNMNNGQSFSNATKDIKNLQNTIDGLSAIMANQDKNINVINEAGRDGITSLVQLGNSDFINENNRTQQESSI